MVWKDGIVEPSRAPRKFAFHELAVTERMKVAIDMAMEICCVGGHLHDKPIVTTLVAIKIYDELKEIDRLAEAGKKSAVEQKPSEESIQTADAEGGNSGTPHHCVGGCR